MDLVARLGGDEFAVILADQPAESVLRVADRLVDVLAEPLAVEGNLVSVSASIGIALCPSTAPVATCSCATPTWRCTPPSAPAGRTRSIRLTWNLFVCRPPRPDPLHVPKQAAGGVDLLGAQRPQALAQAPLLARAAARRASTRNAARSPARLRAACLAHASRPAPRVGRSSLRP